MPKVYNKTYYRLPQLRDYLKPTRYRSGPSRMQEIGGSTCFGRPFGQVNYEYTKKKIT